MVEEAAKYEAEDKAIMERIEARNALESYLYGVRNMGQTADSKLGEEDKPALEAVVKEGLDWLDANREADVDTLKAKKKEMETAIKPFMMKFYGTTDPDAPAPGPKIEEVD